MSNNPDPQILAQLMAMYQSGQIKLPNQDQNQGQNNNNMNPFYNNNNGTVFLNNNQNQNQFGFNQNQNQFGFNQNQFGFNPAMYGSMNVNNANPGFNFNFNNQDLNNMPNNMVNNMQNNMQNIMQNNMQNQEQNWSLIFETKPGNSQITIQIGSSEILSSAFAKYRTKSMKNDTSLMFKFKGKPLDPKLTISGSGLNDKAVITVEERQSNPPQNNNNNHNKNAILNNDPNQMNLFFEKRGENQVMNIQIQPDKYVRDAILAYKNKVNKDGNMIFIFNSKTLDENMTLKQAGLNTGARILVVETAEIIGA